MPQTQSIIRTAIRTELARRDWRVADLARLAVNRQVCSRPTVFQWLASGAGNRTMSVNTAEKLAKLLGLYIWVE